MGDEHVDPRIINVGLNNDVGLIQLPHQIQFPPSNVMASILFLHPYVPMMQEGLSLSRYDVSTMIVMLPDAIVARQEMTTAGDWIGRVTTTRWV
jgi:hypothetical protein